MNTINPALETKVETSKSLNLALWAVQIGVAGMFFMAGSSKLAGNEQMVAVFGAVGIGQWFRVLTGALEILGALLVLIPATAGIGGLLLTPVMIGAVATHLFILGGSPLVAVVLLVASLFIAWGRRDRTRQLLGRIS